MANKMHLVNAKDMPSFLDCLDEMCSKHIQINSLHYPRAISERKHAIAALNLRISLNKCVTKAFKY